MATLPKALIAVILVCGPGVWGCADAFPDLLQGHEVLVGLAAPKIDLAQCFGTDCTPLQLPRAPIPGDEAACDPGEATVLEPIRSTSVVRDNACPDPDFLEVGCATSRGVDGVECDGMTDCLLRISALAPASDQSLWIAGVVRGNDASALESRFVSAIWLAHEAVDGTRLSATLIARESFSEREVVAHDVALAVDERDHALVVAQRFTGPGEQGWFTAESDMAIEESLRVFTPEGSEVGPAIPIVASNADAASRGPSVIVMHRAGRGLALGQTRFGGGAAGIFELETRTMRWVHTRERRLGFQHMVSDASGAITLLTRSPNQTDSGRIEHYDDAGALAWERIWTEDEFASSNGADLTLASDGSLWIAAVGGGESTLVHRIAADGSRRTTTRLAPLLDPEGTFVSVGMSGGGQAMLSTQGSLLVDAGNLQIDEGVPMNSFQEISDDGSRCRVYTWPELVRKRGFAVDAGRRLHFVTDAGYGAFQLPEFSTP